MSEVNKIVNLSEKFFTQRSELYGDEWYLNTQATLKSPDAVFKSLDSFYEEIKHCQKCGLSKSRKNFVFGVGDSNANLMCIGEAPGHEEDKLGKPFVGAAGELLNKILAAIEFKREEVYIANILKCRPPGNRDPLPEEISECLPYLKLQISMIQPKVILVLGRVAAQSLLGTNETLGNLRLQIHRFNDIPVFVTYHPAALLRNPQWKRSTWDDVKKLRKYYDQEVADKPIMKITK